jgi:hypothetical protein
VKTGFEPEKTDNPAGLEGLAVWKKNDATLFFYWKTQKMSFECFWKAEVRNLTNNYERKIGRITCLLIGGPFYLNLFSFFFLSEFVGP